MIEGRIATEQAKRLTVAQEIGLLLAAVEARPDARPMRLKLARLLVVDDRFEEALRLLPASASDDGFGEAMLRFQAHISLETRSDDLAAAAAAERAVALAGDKIARAAALADLGKAERRLGRIENAEGRWRAALAVSPDQPNAIKRLAALLLQRDEGAELLVLTDALLARGAGNARLLAARTLAQCCLGDAMSARDTSGIDALRFETRLQPPPGWASIDAFNADLVREVVTHPGLRFDRYGTASSDTWRVDEPLTGAPPAVEALQGALAEAAAAFVGTLAGRDHPWLATSPAACRLHSWCVITDGIGFEHWHVHQQGWMSGVYYAAVPGHVQRGNGPAGCLAFGIDENLVGEEAGRAFGLAWVRPQPGLVAAFPSHLYHRTFPHGTDERRVAFAFDIRRA